MSRHSNYAAASPRIRNLTAHQEGKSSGGSQAPPPTGRPR
jgi:hypothetical protein